MSKKIIPIVMAANDQYAPYLGVAIASLVEHASKDSVYKIHILETKISDSHQKRIKRLEKQNVFIEFFDVSHWINDYDIPTVNHLTPETTYRLLIDKVFPEYSKLIYIDCDIVVCKDLANLYDIELEDYILGAVRGRLFPASAKYILEKLNLPLESYFNAGVLLVNLRKFAQEKIGDRGLKMLEKKRYATQDQDVLNLLCVNQVKFLDGRWNVEWEHLTGFSGSPVIDKSRQGTLELLDDPYIVHYTSGIKPWMRPDIELAEIFWQAARKTIFYEEIIFQNIEKRNLYPVYVFPWSIVEANSKIVLYGYGNVGRALYEQVVKNKSLELVAVCDKRAKQIFGLATPTIVPAELSEYDFDIIIIAVKLEEVANNIKRELLKLGIQESKIRWKSPMAN